MNFQNLLGDIGNLFKNQTFADVLKGGSGLFNAWNAHQMMGFQKDLMMKQFQMQQDIFNRNKKSEENLHKLVF